MVYACLYTLAIIIFVCRCVIPHSLALSVSLPLTFWVHSDRAPPYSTCFLFLLALAFYQSFVRSCIIHVFIYKHSINDTANSSIDNDAPRYRCFPLAFAADASVTRKCELLSSSNWKVLELARVGPSR